MSVEFVPSTGNRDGIETEYEIYHVHAVFVPLFSPIVSCFVQARLADLVHWISRLMLLNICTSKSSLISPSSSSLSPEKPTHHNPRKPPCNPSRPTTQSSYSRARSPLPFLIFVTPRKRQNIRHIQNQRHDYSQHHRTTEEEGLRGAGDSTNDGQPKELEFEDCDESEEKP